MLMNKYALYVESKLERFSNKSYAFSEFAHLSLFSRKTKQALVRMHMHAHIDKRSAIIKYTYMAIRKRVRRLIFL